MIWEPPYLPVKLSESAAIQPDADGCITLCVEGHCATLTNEETTLLLRLLCPTQAQTDADYEQMFDTLQQQTEAYRSMSAHWARIARYWHARAKGLAEE